EGCVGSTQAWRALPDVDKPVLVPIDQRPEQYAPKQAEHHGIGPNSEGQRDYDRRRKPFFTRQRTGANFQVVQERRYIFAHADPRLIYGLAVWRPFYDPANKGGSISWRPVKCPFSEFPVRRKTSPLVAKSLGCFGSVGGDKEIGGDLQAGELPQTT